jgi:hypothetical protein
VGSSAWEMKSRNMNRTGGAWGIMDGLETEL